MTGRHCPPFGARSRPRGGGIPPPMRPLQGAGGGAGRMPENPPPLGVWPCHRQPGVACSAPVRASVLQRAAVAQGRSEEHTSELQSLMRISYAVFCLKKKKTQNTL